MFLEFLKGIGLIPFFGGVIPFLISILQLFMLCFFGFIIFYLICKTINKKFNFSFNEILNKDITNWEKTFLSKLFWKYPLWGFVQQLIILIIFYFLRRVFSDWIAIIIASFIFAGLHFPNLFLFLATYGLEQTLLAYFLHCYNLYFIAFIHGFLGTVLMYFAPSVLYTRFSTWKNYWELYK